MTNDASVVVAVAGVMVSYPCRDNIVVAVVVVVGDDDDVVVTLEHSYPHYHPSYPRDVHLHYRPYIVVMRGDDDAMTNTPVYHHHHSRCDDSKDCVMDHHTTAVAAVPSSLEGTYSILVMIHHRVVVVTEHDTVVAVGKIHLDHVYLDRKYQRVSVLAPSRVPPLCHSRYRDMRMGE